MDWWQKAMLPMRRVWISVAKHLGIRKSGLLKLQHDVRACQYKDVHIMWEMLQRSDTDIGQTELVQTPVKKHGRPFWKVFTCVSPPYLCRGY